MGAIYIKHIELKGLFGYRNVSWDVHRDVNILGGANGSGKSTLFHVCNQLLGYGYLIDPVLARKIEQAEITFDNDYKMTWDKQSVSKQFKKVKGYVYHNVEDGKVNADGSFLVQRVRLTDNRGDVIHPDEIVLKVPTDIVSSFDQVIREFQKVSDPKKNETDTEDRTYLDKLLTESIAFRNAKISQILLSSLSSVMGAGDKVTGHQITISDKDAQYIMLFRKAMEEFFGSYYEIKGDMESKITLISRKTNEEIPYQDLSLGEKEILLLILHVSNSYDLPVIFWLDEPDLGLHVDWQIKLVNCLRNLNPNIQLFVSTHAPSMVEGHFGKVTEMSQITEERQ